jgi:hypothetical protein
MPTSLPKFLGIKNLIHRLSPFISQSNLGWITICYIYSGPFEYLLCLKPIEVSLFAWKESKKKIG